MAKLNTVQDLAQLREQFQQALTTRAAIFVGTGTCGIAAGAARRCTLSSRNLLAGNSQCLLRASAASGCAPRNHSWTSSSTAVRMCFMPISSPTWCPV